MMHCLLSNRCSEAIFDIPYRSQEEWDAWKFRDDCGPACAAMILDWKGQHYKIDDLSAETSLEQRDNGLFITEVAKLLRTYGIETLKSIDIRAAIDHNSPSIALVKYGAFKDRMNQKFTGLHYVVVVGYDLLGVYVNDPDWYAPRTEEGKNFYIPWDQWNAGYEEAITIL